MRTMFGSFSEQLCGDSGGFQSEEDEFEVQETRVATCLVTNEFLDLVILELTNALIGSSTLLDAKIVLLAIWAIE